MQFRKLQLNWRYGISELVIVVAGVLIAFAADGWRQERQDRSLELELVQALIEDLRIDTAAISSLAAVTQERAEYARLVLSAFETGTTALAPDEFVRAIEFGNYFSYPNYSTATIDDLTSTGRLRLIRSAEVKDAIADYYAEIDWTGQFETLQRPTQRELGQLVSQILDLDYRYALFQEGVGRQCGVRGFSCDGAIPWAPAELHVTQPDADRILKSLLARPQAAPLYAEMARTQGQHYYNLTTIHRLATGALGILEEYAVDEW